MTPKQREALDAVEMYGSQRKAAEALGIKRSTLRGHVERAKKWMKADPAIARAAEAGGLDSPEHLGLIWKKGVKDEDGVEYSLAIRNNVRPNESDEVEQAIREACEFLQDRSPYVTADYRDLGDHMLVMTPADIHMGKLSEALETGDEYTQEIAEQCTKEGVAGLLQMAQGLGVECITVNTGNDSLHVDNSKKTTTSGTPQDTDGSIFSMFTAMQRTWIWVIEECAKVAPVRVVFDPSNHPWVSDWMLNQSIAAWFRNDERVTFDVNMNSIRHRKYQVYGASMIGYSHGNGAKPKDLPSLMQHECREWWGRTKRGYWIIKHTHHKNVQLVGLAPYQAEKDYPGVTVIRTADSLLDRNVPVEVVRSPSSTDGWHHREGFVGAIKAVEAFVFHHERGQVARFTYPFY